MPGPYARPHRTKGSWTPRLAGVAAVVVVAGGVLAIYLGTAKAPDPHKAAFRPRHVKPTAQVVSEQTVGLVLFGPDDNGHHPNHHRRHDHPLMLLKNGNAVDWAAIPRSQVTAGTPEWTADQTAAGAEIFIYIPTGQCLTATSGNQIELTHCDLGVDQRWRSLNAEVVLGQPIAQYLSVETGDCLTAPLKKPGPAVLAPCGPQRTKTQEIAFWWSA
jgi:hypothetical protein